MMISRPKYKLSRQIRKLLCEDNISTLYIILYNSKICARPNISLVKIISLESTTDYKTSHNSYLSELANQLPLLMLWPLGRQVRAQGQGFLAPRPNLTKVSIFRFKWINWFHIAL